MDKNGRNGWMKFTGIVVTVVIFALGFFRGYGKVEARLDAVEEKATKIAIIQKDVSKSQQDIALIQKDISYIQTDIKEQKDLSKEILEAVKKINGD